MKKRLFLISLTLVVVILLVSHFILFKTEREVTRPMDRLGGIL